jgi:hypothetical protein
MNTKFACTKRRRRRTGIAPLEFVMFLPVFVAFILLFMWISRVQNHAILASLETDLAVQRKAIRLAEEQTLATSKGFIVEESGDLQQLLEGFRSDIRPGQGIVDSDVQRDTGPGIRGVVAAAGLVKDAGMRLADTWGDSVFQFPEHRNEQRPLELPEVVSAIAPRLTRLDAFRGLLEFGGRPLANAGGLVGNLSQQALQAADTVEQAVDKLRSEIDSIEQEIEKLKQMEIVDWDRINQLRRTLAEKQGQLTTLSAALPHTQLAARKVD